MINLKNKEKKEIEKEKKAKKSFPLPLIILLVLALAGILIYKFFYTKIQSRIAGYLVSKSLSKQLDGDVKIEEDGEKVSYKGEDFEFSYDSGGELPEDFPKDFPVYKNATLISKWSSTDKEESGTSVMWETEDSVAKVSDFYKEELVKAGWKIISTFSQEESSIFTIEKEETEGYLAIAKTDNKVNISITFGQ